MKILIAGNGKMGQTLARQLSTEGYDLILIDSDSQVLQSGLEEYDVMAVQGNCASMEVLQNANVESADLLIATTGSDEVNLLCCMTAHQMNPNLHTIARIRDPEYVEQIYRMRGAFALSMIFNPERQAAQGIERLLHYPAFLKRDTFANGRVEIVELQIEEGSKLCNVSLSELGRLVNCKVLVCSVLRNGETITPDGRFVLHAHDRIFVTAPTEALSVLLKNLGIVTHKARRVMLVGGSRIAYYLAELLQKSHIDVTVIDRDPQVCLAMATALPKINVICADASTPAAMEREGLADCDALVTLTASDELNMILSLYAKHVGVGQTVTKLSHLDETSFTDILPLGSVMCPQKFCCHNIVRYVRAMRNQTGAALTIHSIADGNAEAMEFAVDEATPYCGVPLREIKLKKNILLVGINRGTHTEIPDGNSTFVAGDRLVVVASGEAAVMQLGDIFA